MKSASLAIEPLMLAERDREYLKQLRRNRWVGKCEMGPRNIKYSGCDGCALMSSVKLHRV